MYNTYMSYLLASAKPQRPHPVKEVLVIDLAKFGGAITPDEALIIKTTSDWVFRYCLWTPKTNVRKAIFERLT